MLDAIGGAMGASMISFKQAGLDGSFTINETGGKALLAAIDEMAKWVEDNLADLSTLGKSPKLGSSKGADLMKPYVQKVATDDQGFITQLKEFRQSLADAQEGVQAAMRNYGHVEQGIQGNFRVV
ncbi:hypothetical protein [Actinophytocola sp.]|uniref:hypothetical protein n=1 Tax=Actinophytocola sp. TaxID=1872138 RepID=UPI00389A11C5